jgi:hypothetical protein
LAFNGAGTFLRLYSWTQDKLNAIKINASRMDAEMDGFATGLSNCITKDGQTTITANIPFNGRKITGLGDATADTDALNRQSGDARFVRLSGGSTGGAMTGALNFARGSDIASAAITDIGAATGNYVTITGTTTITALGTVQAGTVRFVRFSGALTLTHNAASLILPGGSNIITAAGDVGIFVSEGSGNWRCLSYSRGNGQAGSVVNSAYAEYTTNANLTTVIPADDTIPQVGEGTQVLSVSLTPSTATNKVRVRVQITGAVDTASTHLAAALFVNGAADAVAADMIIVPGVNFAAKVAFEFEHTPGSTSAQTYTVRVGPSGGTARLNGVATARRLGGTMRSSIVVEEIRA